MTKPALVPVLLAAGLTAAAVQAQTPPRSTQRPAAAAPAPAVQSAPATPSGDTHVHRFFQAWGRGMDKAGSGLDKLPKPDARWPGAAGSGQRSPSPSHEAP